MSSLLKQKVWLPRDDLKKYWGAVLTLGVFLPKGSMPKQDLRWWTWELGEKWLGVARRNILQDPEIPLQEKAQYLDDLVYGNLGPMLAPESLENPELLVQTWWGVFQEVHGTPGLAGLYLAMKGAPLEEVLEALGCQREEPEEYSELEMLEGLRDYLAELSLVDLVDLARG